MKTRFSILFLLLMVVIILFTVIVFKIKSDKKRKSLVISSSERDKDIRVIKKEPQKRPYLMGIPSWALSLIAMFGIFIVIMVIGEGVKTDTIIGEVIAYIILSIVNAICCFLIVRRNPKSIWYVPLILNVIYIISAFVESMETFDWIAVCGIFALSLIASIIGARTGRKGITERPGNFLSRL